MKIEMKNWSNEVVGEIEIPETVFDREVSEHLVWEVVRAYLADISGANPNVFYELGHRHRARESGTVIVPRFCCE